LIDDKMKPANATDKKAGFEHRAQARSCFLRYHRAVAKNESVQPAAAERAARSKRRLRIIVADDDRDHVITLAALLMDEGHEVRELYLGSEVVRLVREFDPDVALIDISMPGMNGYDAAREIRQEFGKRRPMLIAITGWRQSSDRILAKLAGFDHHMPKPFDPKALLELISPLAEGSGTGA
jgi:CheY-like chemotaxis protein